MKTKFCRNDNKLNICSILAAVFITTIFCYTSNAQDKIYGGFNGRVTDEQELPLPNVLVTFINTSTEGTVNTRTNSNGIFIESGLSPGVYIIKFSLSGYETLLQEGRYLLATRSKEVVVTTILKRISNGVEQSKFVPNPSESLNLPLTSEAVVKILHSSRLTQEEVGFLVDGKGVNFRLTPEIESELTIAGASASVIEAVRKNHRTTNATATTIKPLLLSGKYYALVIGNNNYQNVAKLKTAETDANVVASVLRDKYAFEPKLLLNATRQDVLGAINTYRRTLGENDNLLIYYAGHGYNDPEVEETYWIPIDGSKEDNANWISANDITRNVKGIKAKHVLIVSDSCYSGAIDRQLTLTESEAASGRDKFLQKMINGKSRALMASGGNEPVLDGGGGKHSMFAKAFLTGLAEMDKGAFTASELFRDFVQERVAGGAEQTPQYKPLGNSGHESGEFVFIRKQ